MSKKGVLEKQNEGDLDNSQLDEEEEEDENFKLAQMTELRRE